MTHQSTLTLAPNGRVVVPASMREQLGLQGGGKLLARLENGAVILEPVETAIRRAQAMVRGYVPENSRLVDELIAERHAAIE
jgi:AbrB family looped-hinge helix DNA binding protein